MFTGKNLGFVKNSLLNIQESPHEGFLNVQCAIF